MSAAGTRSRTATGVGALFPVFARTRGSWWISAAATVAALVIVLLHAVTQTLTLSPDQNARGYFGDYEYAKTNLTTFPLGSGPDLGALERELGAAGATAVGASMHAINLGDAAGLDLPEVRYEERDLQAKPTGVVHLVEGAAPGKPGEACASPALQRELNGARDLAFLDGTLRLTVTCTAVYDHGRDGVTVFAAPGTWAQAGAGLSAEDVQRWGVEAGFNLYWAGGDPAAVDRAVEAWVGPPAAGQEFEVGAEGVVETEAAARMREQPRTFNALGNAWGFLVPLYVVPFTASAITAWGSARLLARSADTLVGLGLRRARIRQLTFQLPLVLALAGTAAGVLLGVLLGLVGRYLLAPALTQPLGPWVGAPIVVGIVLAMSLLGVLAGVALASARLSSRARQDLAWARWSRLPWPSTPLLAGLIVLCILGAVICVTTAASNTQRTAGVVLIGAAVVLTIPLFLGVRARRGIAQTPAGFVRARLIMTGGGAWLVMLLFGLQAVLTTSVVTLTTSSTQTYNSALVSTVPEDQARLDVLNVGDEQLAASLIEDVRRRLGSTEDFSYRFVEAGTTAGDGSVVVVETARQAADVLGLDSLEPAAEEALADGHALRGVTAPEGMLTVLDYSAADPSSASAELAEFPVTVVEGGQGTFSQGGGVILQSTADSASGLPISPAVAHVFPRLSDEQRTVAVGLPEELRFNPDWMDLPKAPDRMTVPAEVTWGAGIVAALGVALALIYGLQAGAAGRGVLAGAHSMGLSRAWVRSVLGGQIAWVVLAPALAGVVGSATGAAVMFTLNGFDVDVHIPWGIVGIMAGGTALAFFGALALALRGLDVRERLG